jgi:hypothetical protein
MTQDNKTTNTTQPSTSRLGCCVVFVLGYVVFVLRSLCRVVLRFEFAFEFRALSEGLSCLVLCGLVVLGGWAIEPLKHA